MSDWQNIGSNLEAKFSGNSEIWVRNDWQTSDYPHLIINLNNQGAIINVRTSNGSHGGSLESRGIIANLVKKKLLSYQVINPE
jgi:hypothetical protein